MSKIELKNSTLVQNLVMQVQERSNGFIQDKVAIESYKAMMYGVTAFLAAVKSTKTPMVFTITDTEDNFTAGAIVEYNESPEEENEEVSGNWNYFWTFDKKDIPEDAVVYDVKSSQTHDTLKKEAFKYASVKYFDNEALISMFNICFSVLRDYLLENAKEDDVFELVDPGVFTAQATVENGEKVISLVPDGLVKTKIKDDRALESENESK